MDQPLKQYFSITDVANRWNVSKFTIENYLLSGELKSIINLPRVMLRKNTLQCSDPYDDEYSIFDIDIHDPESITPYHGTFNLLYPEIAWDEFDNALLNQEDMCLTLTGDEGIYYSFNESFLLKKENVAITLQEILRFETSCSIKGLEINKTTEEPIAKSSIVPGEINVNAQNSLLKIVIAMAVKTYKYNPSSKRNNVAASIVHDAESIGINIEEDTVRKWLKKSAFFIEGDVLRDLDANSEEK